MMKPPRFVPHDVVSFARRTLDFPTSRSGQYVVIRVLPEERGRHQYRLRSVEPGPDRIAFEDELTR